MACHLFCCDCGRIRLAHPGCHYFTTLDLLNDSESLPVFWLIFWLFLEKKPRLLPVGAAACARVTEPGTEQAGNQFGHGEPGGVQL